MANNANKSSLGEWQLVEISEWFDWINGELGSGRIVAPSDEEQLVLAIAHALATADGIGGRIIGCSTELRDFLVRAAILHECWLLEAGKPVTHTNSASVN